MIWILVGLLALVGFAVVIAGARRRRAWQLVGGALLLAAALALAQNHVTRSPDLAPLDPNPSSDFQIVALGDSYISGEGAEHYFEGTDEPDPTHRNLCHRASAAYPYILAEELGASLHFIACSGAKTADVTAHAQYPLSKEGVVGDEPQLALLEGADPDMVLISIGGNDAGFAEIGIDCALPGLPDCRRAASFWLHRLDADVYPRLVRTFRAVRRAAEGAPVFAFTYPNPLGPRFCNDLVGLSRAEMAFVREVFAPRLNRIVKSAAALARVRVIDFEKAVDGHRFCEKPLGQTAVNFVELEHTRGAPIQLGSLGDIAKGSLHPNRLGHELLARKALSELRAAKEGKLEALPALPGPDERPPPFDVEEAADAPTGLSALPPDIPCVGGRITLVSRVSAEPDLESVALSEVQPGSTVCYRTYRDEWHSTGADGKGNAIVPVDVTNPGVGSINEILAEQQGAWKKVVVSRLGAADEAVEPAQPSKLGLYLLIAAIVAALVAALVILVKFSSDAGD